MAPTPRYRSKTAAAWLALLFGTLGAHRIYLYGPQDRLSWLYPLPTALGLAGVLRMRAVGVDDGAAALLIPMLGLMISIAMLSAIRLALTPDEKWDVRYNPAQPPRATGWGAVLAAIVALLLGSAALMATLAFSSQRFFEWQQESATSDQKSAPLTQ